MASGDMDLTVVRLFWPQHISLGSGASAHWLVGWAHLVQAAFTGRSQPLLSIVVAGVVPQAGAHMQSSGVLACHASAFCTCL